MFSKIKELSDFPQDKKLKITTLVSLVFAIAIFLLMLPVETELKSLTPYGVMDLEFAWTVSQINKIFSTWGNSLIMKELGVTLLDFAFLVYYSIFMAGVTLILTRRVFSGVLHSWGYKVTLVPFLAAFFDVVENLNIIFMLISPYSYPVFAPLLVSICATVKFTLLGITIIFWLLGIITALLSQK